MLDDPLAGSVRAGTVGLGCLELGKEIRAPPGITAWSAQGGGCGGTLWRCPLPKKEPPGLRGDHRASAEISFSAGCVLGGALKATGKGKEEEGT